ncbi:hypothetical protein IEO21_08622 [Rhodonia placenta]|uniref:Ribonuclease H n=1 Tax=Rhodonia placenta TaxID=104341 RepID=A0A8H7TZ25_9APHY|nr:hypothetical protein IEO21_08622 [Postia placenta]
MPKASKLAFYAVAKGKQTGVYSTWDECEAQTIGFAGARYKKFNNAADAEAYVAQFVPGLTANINASSTSAAASAAPALSVTNDGRWKRATETLDDESGWDVVYSDGACKGNGKLVSIAGIGVWWGRNDSRNLAERCPGVQTNNRAELIAIVRVLETAPKTKRPLLIKTDSQYSINCFQSWMPKWLQKGFVTLKGKPIKNEALIRYLSALLDERARGGQRVSFQYVRGHVGEEGNEGADYLANVGATHPELPERDWEELRQRIEEARDASSTPVTLKITQKGVEMSPAESKTTSAGKSEFTPQGVDASGPKIKAASQPKSSPVASTSALETATRSSIVSETVMFDEELQEYADCLLSPEELEEEFLWGDD